jgi:xylan 1,4-beta-xylosidase
VAYANPVVPGDYPDPTVLRDGTNYWAVVTSGRWRPPFTVLYSQDLVNWSVAGSILRNRPSWARGDFWAPELVKQGSRYLVYYSARRLDGRLCVAVGQARSPISFFRDRGPLVCPQLGAIDPLAVQDEAGRPYLIWKVDGNDRGRPTPIVAAPLRPDGLRLAGPPRELFHNDQPWEGRVIEGPALARHDGSLYLFYSARSCCGPTCDYVLGVARAPALFGRWEKHPGPVLTGDTRFRCPGHGAIAEGPGGEQYLVYHAYGERGSVDVGRQLLLDKIEWSPDGWPRVNGGQGPSADALSPGGVAQLRRPEPFTDEFRVRFLTAGWQWTAVRPAMRVDPRRGGRLWLGTVRRGRRTSPGIVGRQPGADAYVAEAVVGRPRGGALPSLAAYADAGHALGIEVRKRRVVVWREVGSHQRVLAARPIGRRRFAILRLRALGSRLFAFDVWTRRGFAQVGAPRGAPRWRGGIRVVLRVSGGRRARAPFERFSLRPPG